MNKAVKPKAKAVKKAEESPPPNIPPHDPGAPAVAERCSPEDFATWMLYEEWTLFGGAMLMLGLVPTQRIFAGDFITLDYVNTSIPPKLRQKLNMIYGLSKEKLKAEATYRQIPAQFPRAYVKREKYLAWAKAQAWLDVPTELQQARESRYWMRQDTKEKVTPAQAMTTAKIMTAYANRMDDGEARLRRMFDPKGSVRTENDIDPRPLRVVWNDSGKAVRGKYVTELVQKCLEPFCTKDPFNSAAPGIGRKRGTW